LTETSLCGTYLYFIGKFHERMTVGRLQKGVLVEVEYRKMEDNSST
jgi:hypothetical protein